MKLGAYHTLELEPQRSFTLEKAVWDALDIERIKQACDPAASADLAAVLITVRHNARTHEESERLELERASIMPLANRDASGKLMVTPDGLIRSPQLV